MESGFVDQLRDAVLLLQTVSVTLEKSKTGGSLMNSMPGKRL
ncbi:hypothetical protein [uncultured Exiguobacterium sp.]|nr:hypothetical protein [uncultured Exiguobacterium sp.]